MKRQINDKNQTPKPHQDKKYTMIMVRHRTKIASGFIVKYLSSDRLFIQGYKHEDNTVKRFKTPDMTMNELHNKWVIVEDLKE